MTTFITVLDAEGDGPTLAVKDLIDIAGTVTTAGSRAVASSARPAVTDAACLAGARAAGARIVGKTNLHELAFGTTGVNESYGTPLNPFDPTIIPGGSSSGSAVAVALGDAELALGSDTGGSIRIPAAFCGVTGLKTTFGRISNEGVWPLAPSLDTVGPMARDVGGVVRAMTLLEPGFTPSPRRAASVGRIRLPGTEADPDIDVAVDDALDDAGFAVVDVVIPEWNDAYAHALDLLLFEAVESNHPILADPDRRALLGAQVAERLSAAETVTKDRADAARSAQAGWTDRLDELFGTVDLLALPSVPWYPTPIEDARSRPWNSYTLPFNYAGVPAISLPVRGGWIPPSVQLIGPKGSEELLVTSALAIETTAGWVWTD